MIYLLQGIILSVIVSSVLMLMVLRHPVHCVMSVLVCIIASAMLWMTMYADFLALVLLIMHAGALMTMFLYVTMTLEEGEDMHHAHILGYSMMIVMGCVWVMLLGYLMPDAVDVLPSFSAGDVAHMGRLWVGAYGWVLWVLGLMLTLSMMVCVHIIHTPQLLSMRRQEVSEQVYTTVDDRLRFKTPRSHSGPWESDQ